MNSNDELAYRERQGRRAAVRAIPNFLIVEAMSGRGITSPDPDAFHAFLPINAGSSSLSAAVLSALAASRFLSVAEAGVFTRQEADQRWSNWVSKMLGATGMRNETALFKRMALCHVSLKGEVVSLSPTAKRRGIAWEGLGVEQHVAVPTAMGPSALAAGLREAFMRCSPEIAVGAQQGIQADGPASGGSAA